MLHGFHRDITVEDISVAEAALLEVIQRQSFPDEIETLRERGGDGVKELQGKSPICHLNPLLIERVLHDRLARSSISEGSKYPVLLPQRHHVATLLIRDIRKNLGHERNWVRVPGVFTPNHVLTGKSQVIVPPPGKFQRDDISSEALEACTINNLFCMHCKTAVRQW